MCLLSWLMSGTVCTCQGYKFYTVKKEKGQQMPLLINVPCGTLRSLRTKHTTWVTEAEAITLTSLVSHITCVEISFHRSSNRSSFKMLKAIWNVSQNEERISVSQEMVDCITLRQQTHVPDCVDVVVGSSDSSR